PMMAYSRPLSVVRPVQSLKFWGEPKALEGSQERSEMFCESNEGPRGTPSCGMWMPVNPGPVYGGWRVFNLRQSSSARAVAAAASSRAAAERRVQLDTERGWRFMAGGLL